MPTSTAIFASAFISTLGINTHLDYNVGPYKNTTVSIASINYLGVKNLRDSANSHNAFTIWPKVSQATGAKFINYMNRGSRAGMQSTLDRTPRLASLGVLNFIEGANEPDTPDAMAAGNSLTYGAYFQQRVFAMGRNLKLPVINLSVGSGWTAADGYQGNYDSIGNLSGIADYANAHTYPAVAKGLPYKTVDRLNNLALLGAPGKPVIISEMGWDTAVVGQDVAAINMLNGIMDAAYLKNTKTYIFALYDDKSGKWGVMNADGTPRTAGKALHNLTTLLADSGTVAGAAGSLTYQLSGTKGTERTFLMAKTDGSYWLSVWDETNAAYPVTLTLPAAAREIQAYNPMTAVTPIQSVANVTSITVTLGSTPVIFKVVPATATTTASITPPATTTSTTTSPATAPVVTTPPATTPPATTPLAGSVITNNTSNTTITASASTMTIYNYGSGNTINAGAATTLVQSFGGGATIRLNGATGIVNVGGTGNKIFLGTNTVRLNESGKNDVITFTAIGAGAVDIYGYIFANGTKLDLKTLLAGTQWNRSAATLGHYLKVVTVGTNVALYITPSGLATGPSYNFANLRGLAPLSLSTILANSIY